MAVSFSQYGGYGPDDDYKQRSMEAKVRAHMQEQEYHHQREMMMALQNRNEGQEAKAPEPKKPAALNPKLLLTKG